jgi:hypothetical protein
MVYFQTKNPNWGKFWRVMDWKMLIYFMTIWNSLRTFGIFYDHLVRFVLIWYILSGFGIMYQDKSGIPDDNYLCCHNFVVVVNVVRKRLYSKVLDCVQRTPSCWVIIQ